MRIKTKENDLKKLCAIFSVLFCISSFFLFSFVFPAQFLFLLLCFFLSFF